MLSSIFGASPTPSNSLESAAELVENSFSIPDLGNVLSGLTTGANSPVNINLKNPDDTIYPKKWSDDAPYSQSEAALRQQIHIPSTFTYGKVPPIILVPGTGAIGGENFETNFIKLFTGSSFADPVWINPPTYQLGDAQKESEVVAYAINYISGISGNVNVSTLGWSQGNIQIRWATKYWPSTRNSTSDHISISADYAGTVIFSGLSDLLIGAGVGSTPSLLQQGYYSNFIDVLRSNGGDSAYVPTTSLYSGFFDEIVEPQQGTGASAYTLDAHNVGVTNAEVNVVCSEDSAAGFFNTHESMLYNALSYALAVDALTHPGPGDIGRLDLETVCSQVAAPGLSLEDVVETEATIPIAAAAILLYPDRTTTKPAISPYASASPAPSPA